MITERVSKRHGLRYLVRVDWNGRKETIGTFRTRREAERAEREARNEMDRGTFVPKRLRDVEPDPDQRVIATVGDALAEWLESKQGDLASNSFVDYSRAASRFVAPAFGAYRLAELTTAVIQRQYDRWAASWRRYCKAVEAWEATPERDRGPKPARDGAMSPRTIRQAHLVLNQTMARMARHGLIANNPCEAASPARLSRATVDAWNRDETDAFLRTAFNRPELNRGGDTGRRAPDALWPLWALLALEGMRRGEALGLRWADINWERGTAHIAQTVISDRGDGGKVKVQPRGKTRNASRSVRLTRLTLDALREHRKRQNAHRLAAPVWHDHDLIVCTSLGTPVTPDGNVNRSFDAIIRATRLPDGSPLRRIRVHDLRHTAATLLLLAGENPKVVSERLGHASIAITLDLYSHVLPDMQASAADRMDAMFSLSTIASVAI